MSLLLVLIKQNKTTIPASTAQNSYHLRMAHK